MKDEIKTNKTFVDACNNAKSKSNGRLHLLGLVIWQKLINFFAFPVLILIQVSDGGVHSHIDHMFGLIKAAKQLGVPKLFLHFFGDGRDTSPTSGGKQWN